MIAYLLKFYPKISEAFILDELCEMKRQGAPFLIWALGRWTEEKEHPEAADLSDRVRYLDMDGLGKIPKAASLARLWLQNRAQLGRAHKILRREYGDLLGFTFSQSLPRALELQRRGVKHIHAHFASSAADHALVLSLLSGIPFSLTVHGSDVLVDNHPTLDLICKHAAGILTPSRYNANYMIERFSVPPERMHVIANGVIPERFQPSTGSGDGPPILLTVARLEEVKGIPVLVDAYALLRKKGVSFRAVIVGEGSERPRVEDRIREHHLGGLVELRGDLPRDRVLSELGGADIFVLSSQSEGFPVSILEAMSCGLPVVAPEITGIPEMIREGEHGFLVTPRDAAALAEGMERLIVDADLRVRLGRAARERVVREFSLSHVVQERIRFFNGDRPSDRS